MNDYKHGNWYCKPASEAEAREIVKRAVASGAKSKETPEVWEWSAYGAWGVRRGCTHTQSVVFYRDRDFTEYTIEQVREKFPLPGEHEWNGEGLPPVGVECEFYRADIDRWVGCTTVGMFRNEMICAPDAGGFFAGKAENFRPIRSERDQWVEDALSILQKDPSAMPKQLMSMIYDALKSGDLKAPE